MDCLRPRGGLSSACRPAIDVSGGGSGAVIPGRTAADRTSRPGNARPGQPWRRGAALAPAERSTGAVARRPDLGIAPGASRTLGRRALGPAGPSSDPEPSARRDPRPPDPAAQYGRWGWKGSLSASRAPCASGGRARREAPPDGPLGTGWEGTTGAGPGACARINSDGPGVFPTREAAPAPVQVSRSCKTHHVLI